MQRIGNGGGLAREAILAALEKHRDAASRVDARSREVFASQLGELGVEPTRKPERPEESLLSGALKQVNAAVQDGERIPEDLLSGEIGGIHEVAARIRRAELTMSFALEVRNKLVEAYREVMRMQV